MTAFLDIRDLTVAFDTDGGAVPAARGISYSLEEGEVLGVVGESGSGKSVHALAIMRLIPAPPGRVESGEIWFGGQDLLRIGGREMRGVRGKQISMVFQDPMSSLNPVYTVGFQIRETLRLHLGLARGAATRRAVELLDLVGIPDPRRRLASYPHELSGGMRQRVMIAMALAGNPRLVIADEPTTALDVTIQAQIIELIKRAARGARPHRHLDHPRSGHRCRPRAPRERDVCRLRRGTGPGAGNLQATLPALHRWACSPPCPAWTARRAGSASVPIPGRPPDLARIGPGCPFQPRCPLADERVP